MTRVNGYDDSWISNLVGFQQHAGSYSGLAITDISLSASGQMRIAAQNNVGVLEYRQGSHEGWAVKVKGQTTGGPASDGFHPLVPSGIIPSLVSLQRAYGNSQSLDAANAARIITNATGGAVQFVTDTRKFNFLPWSNTRAPLNISGVPQYNTGAVGTYDVGDLTLINNGSIIPGGGATSDEIATAQSLGVSTLALNTNSGIINLMLGSGIGYYVQDTARNIGVNPDTWTRFPFETISIGDANFGVDSNLSGIRVWVPGLYKVDYEVGFQKTAGTTGRTMASRLVKFEASQISDAININGARTVLGSYAWGQITNITSLTRTTTHGSCLVNVQTAGALLGVEGTFVGQGAAGQNASSIPSGTSIVIQRIGPNRSGF
jgi:hypothetical protein